MRYRALRWQLERISALLASAQVNRVFMGKQGGLVVEHIDDGQEQMAAMEEHTASEGRGEPKMVPLGKVIKRYQSRSIETAQVMEELEELVLEQAGTMGDGWVR